MFPGNAKYNNRGNGGSEPGSPTFQTTLGDGTVLDYNFVGNAGNGSALTTYASGGAGRIPTPTSPSANVHSNGENWANVWTTKDPGAATKKLPHSPPNKESAKPIRIAINFVAESFANIRESGKVLIPSSPGSLCHPP